MPPTPALPEFVIHDMSNAVHAVIGVWSTLDRHVGRLNEVQLRRLLDTLGRQAEVLQSMLHDLSDAARIDAGALGLQTVRVELAAAVDQAVRGITSDGAGTITTSVPDGLAVQADPTRLRQILVNLLGNARLHGGPNTWVDATRHGDRVVVTVSDDGPGLALGDANELFLRFRRGEDSGDQPGSGLGLAIVRELARAMGGDARYVERPRGTQFAVELLAADPETSPTALRDLDEGEVGLDAPFDHAVVMYQDARVVQREIARMVAAGLDAGEGVAVVATRENWAGAELDLAHRHVELVTALADRQVVVLDAAETLASFHDGSSSDPERFQEVIGGLVRELCQRFGHVRAYGEMVALLWEQGDVQGAMDLEHLWNQLYRTCHFGLLCGYRVDPATAPAEDLDQVHHHHGCVYEA